VNSKTKVSIVIRFKRIKISSIQKLSSDVVESLSSDQRNVHTEIAVNAIGFAYKRYLSTCTSRPCFKKTKGDASKWTRAIQDVYIPILDGTNFKPFKSDNNGNLGFTIHNIQKTDLIAAIGGKN
jgi:hypothetical protein